MCVISSWKLELGCFFFLIDWVVVDYVFDCEIMLVFFMGIVRNGFDYIMVIKCIRFYIDDLLWIIV